MTRSVRAVKQRVVERVDHQARRLAALVVAVGLSATFVACSDDDDAAAPSDSAAGATTVEPAPTEQPVVTEPAATEPAATDPATTEPSTTEPSTTEPVTTTAPPTTQVPLPVGYPAQPEGVPYPAGDWPTAPLPAGVDRAAIDAAVDVAFGPADSQSGVRSVVVVQGGSIVYERYHPSAGPDTVFASYSVGKSFTSAIIGLLVDDGATTLDEHPPRPEWPAGDPRAAITMRDLLQMSSGLDWTEEYGPDSLALRMLSAPSAAALMAAQPLERDPGSAFEYSTGTSALIAGIAADEVGGCAALDGFVRTRLLDPIGISSASVLTDGGGCFVGGLGMDMTTRDFARFGLLYLRGGLWDGRQVLSTSWIDSTRVPAATKADYGLQWWLSATGERFAALGLGGQQIVVIPDADLVIAVNSTLGNDGPAATLTDAIAAAFGAPA